MANTLPQAIPMALYRYGRPIQAEVLSPIMATHVLCAVLPGLLMAYTSHLVEIMVIAQYKYGGHLVGTGCMHTSSNIEFLALPGRPIANILLPEEMIQQCRYGKLLLASFIRSLRVIPNGCEQ